MSEDQKKQLQTQLWNIANELRGKMGADEFRDYILGFIFYKYLSEKLTIFANEILEADNKLYKDLDERIAEDSEIIEAVRKDAIDSLGFFLKPDELFAYVAEHGSKGGNLIERLERTLNSIEQSTMGADSEDDFDKLFSELDLNANKLGKTVQARSDLIAKVLVHLDKIDFQLDNSRIDVLGDAYEYLISQFASGAGKKAGEFYTPQEVSTVLAKLVTAGRKKLKNVYDPTCGSGSLLLRVARQVEEVGMFYGQEMNNTTYNLARMNMILHDVNFSKFDIRQEDTLEHPQHAEFRFEAIVANPPFSAKWSANPLHLQDDRFSQYGRLAPASKADYAFIQHMIYQLDENGTMAVVMPHGVLFRSGAEAHIREFLIKEKNYLDAIIGLPDNIFFGTGIPTCILVFKKCRTSPEDILFIDASQEFDKAKKQYKLREEDIQKIINTYNERVSKPKYSHVAKMEEIIENDYNLNIPRYVDIFDEEVAIDIGKLTEQLNANLRTQEELDIKIVKQSEELNIPAPLGANLPALKKYKNGAMQQLFSQKVRFKDNEGQSYSNWQEKTIGQIFEQRQERFKEGLQLLSVTINDGVKKRSDIDSKDNSSSDKSNYKRIYPQDIAYNSMRMWQGASGVSLYDGVVSPAYTVLAGNKENSSLFFGYLFKLRSMVNTFQRHSQGLTSDTWNLKYPQLAKIKVSVPVLEEQQKIANFLSLIDAKIAIIEKDQQE